MTGGLWTRETAALVLLAALLPVAAIWLWSGGGQGLGRLAVSLLVIAAWQLLFMLARAQPPSLAAIAAALAMAMLAPEDLGLARFALGVSFGVVFGDLVFGGWGRNVVHPATVGLAFLGFGFPAFAWPEPDLPVQWAAIPAALIGVAAGVIPAGVVAGAVLTGAALVLAGGLESGTAGVAGLVLVLMVADPVISPSTAPARWLNGAFYTALVATFAAGWAGAAAVQIAVSAALLTALAAPLMDDAALAFWLMNRRRRHGRE